MVPNQWLSPHPYKMVYTSEINRLKIEENRPKRRVEVFKKEVLTELREKLKK